MRVSGQKSGLIKQLGQLVPAMGEELVLLVERGKIRLEHDGDFFSQIKPAAVGGGVVAQQPCQGPMFECICSLVYKI